MAFKDAISDVGKIDAEDWRRLGTAPILLRMLLIILVCALVIGLGAYFMIQPQRDKLVVVKQQEQELRLKFDAEQAKAANLDAYAEQLEEMKKTFNVMVRQLPNQTDIESLLVDLSQTSVASGLEVEFFKPEVEVPREFYAEYPIKISVTGAYHQFGQFVSGLAALPRIVTLDKIDISSAGGSREGVNNRFKMDLVATTYRYLEEDE